MDLVKSFYASPLLSSWHLKPKQRPEENTSSPTLYFSNFMIMSVKKRVLFLLLVLPFFSSFYSLALYEMKPVLESTKLLRDTFSRLFHLNFNQTFYLMVATTLSSLALANCTPSLKNFRLGEKNGHPEWYAFDIYGCQFVKTMVV